MAPTLLGLILMAQTQVVSMLLLQPAEPVKVLVFGDSWGAMGPSFRMLDDMFQRHGVAATVRSTAISGTRACQWSLNPANLVGAIQTAFPFSSADYVWFTLSGNDLLEPEYLDCSKKATTYDVASECALKIARKVHGCIFPLLDTMWKVFPKTKVVQCAYEYQCAEGACLPFSRWPFCDRNISCANVMGMAWQDEMILPIIERYKNPPNPPGRYVGFNIDGILQEAGGYPGAKMGKPDITKGAPCELMLACVHPSYGSAAAVAIGEAFWNLYFSKEVMPSRPAEDPNPKMPPHMAMPSTAEANAADISVADTYCNYNWVPSFGPDAVPPPCNRTSYP